MTRIEAAAYLTARGYPIKPQTLANMASNNNAGNGPRFTRSGWRTIHYEKSDLDAWVEPRLSQPK